MASTKRKLRPRQPFTGMPISFTDQDSSPVTGLTDRQLRDLLRAHPVIPRTVVGQRVIVRVDAFLEALKRLETQSDAGAKLGDQVIDGQELLTIDSVLDIVGRRRFG